MGTLRWSTSPPSCCASVARASTTMKPVESIVVSTQHITHESHCVQIVRAAIHRPQSIDLMYFFPCVQNSSLSRITRLDSAQIRSERHPHDSPQTAWHSISQPADFPSRPSPHPRRERRPRQTKAIGRPSIAPESTADLLHIPCNPSMIGCGTATGTSPLPRSWRCLSLSLPPAFRRTVSPEPSGSLPGSWTTCCGRW